MSEVVHDNWARLRLFKDYVRGRTWQLSKVKTIYRFHKLLFDRGDSSLQCFNWATQIYRLWQLVPDSHSNLQAVAASSWQPLNSTGCGSQFLTATQIYRLWQPVPDSHSNLQAVAVGSSHIVCVDNYLLFIGFITVSWYAYFLFFFFLLII